MIFKKEIVKMDPTSPFTILEPTNREIGKFHFGKGCSGKENPDRILSIKKYLT